MRSPHCPGSGATVTHRLHNAILDMNFGLCPQCRRWVGATKRGTLHHHVATLRTTARLRDDARGTR
jgi:hypothetical protein